MRRSEFCTRADIRCIEKKIEEETIRLATQDGESVLRWVNVLRARGHYVLIKTSNNESPPNSNLDKDTFVLIIQTKYQQECWKKHGHRYAGIDATHNTTHYENMSLFTLLVRDRWGHGECYTLYLLVANLRIYNRILINYRHPHSVDDLIKRYRRHHQLLPPVDSDSKPGNIPRDIHV